MPVVGKHSPGFLKKYLSVKIRLVCVCVCVCVCLATHYVLITRASVSGQLSRTFRLPVKSQPMFIAQTSSLHHSIACHLVSLETVTWCIQMQNDSKDSRTCDRWIIGQPCFSEDELLDRPPSSSYNFTLSDWVIWRFLQKVFLCVDTKWKVLLEKQ